MHSVHVTIILCCIFASSFAIDCDCPSTKEPVCGSNGYTYKNKCLLLCDAKIYPNLVLNNEGACEDPRDKVPDGKCECPDNRERVCGSNGWSYRNKCTLQCDAEIYPDLVVKHEGGCDDPREKFPEDKCGCPDEYKPVCGSDGFIYGSECKINCMNILIPNLKMAYRGSCKERCYCYQLFNPHCASNNVTYRNSCYYSCAVAKIDHNLKLVKKDICDVE